MCDLKPSPSMGGDASPVGLERRKRRVARSRKPRRQQRTCPHRSSRLWERPAAGCKAGTARPCRSRGINFSCGWAHLHLHVCDHWGCCPRCWDGQRVLQVRAGETSLERCRASAGGPQIGHAGLSQCQDGGVQKTGGGLGNGFATACAGEWRPA